MLPTLLYFCVSYFNFIQGANILGVFPFPSPSHQIVFQAIWRELSLRGHNVTVITPDPLNDYSLTNLTEINTRHVYEVWKDIKLQDSGSKDANMFQNLDKSFRLLDIITERQLNATEFSKLIRDKNQKFDLILVECFFSILHILGTRFKAPVIGVSSLGVLAVQHNVVGSPNQPVLYPDLILGISGVNISIWQRVRSVLFNIGSLYYHYNCLIPRLHKMAYKYFGDDIPDVGRLEKNMSLLYLNDNHLLFPPRPQVPAEIQMGQVHIKPAKPLPEELQQILDEATEGVVYFSLGGNVKSVDLDEKLRRIITQALSELPYKVIWKWESDFLPNKPANVIIQKWLPQQDLLAHPNVRVFVTQGGMQSIEEAIDRNVPMVGLPFMYDQPINIEQIGALGIGIPLDPKTVTEEQLKDSIIEVSTNNTYKEKIKKVHNLLFDRQVSGVERAVWWLEYVIRHKGAKHVRSPSADTSWVNYLMLDVFGVSLITLAVVIFGISKVVKVIIKH